MSHYQYALILSVTQESHNMYLVPMEKLSNEQIEKLQLVHNKVINSDSLNEKEWEASFWFSACEEPEHNQPWEPYEDETPRCTRQNYIDFRGYEQKDFPCDGLQGINISLFIKYTFIL